MPDWSSTVDVDMGLLDSMEVVRSCTGHSKHTHLEGSFQLKCWWSFVHAFNLVWGKLVTFNLKLVPPEQIFLDPL